MRSKTNLSAIIVTLFIAVAATAPSANAAPPNDACPLLTQAEVSAVVGVAVGAGSHITPTYLKSCTWAPSGGATKDFSTVLLSLESAASYQSAKAMLQAVANSHDNNQQKSPITMTPASGIGDDALYSSVANYTKLIVKKGDVVFQIVIYGGFPIEKKRDMEKALASKVLSKL
jgi:hypothetical protein